MSFVSYAQNLEDVMLFRALKHIERGFYIDVGSQHPVLDSVTKAFYDRGWSGINIEPVSKYYQLIQKDRPRDININMLVGECEGEREFHEFPETGLSTTKIKFAESNSAAGYAVTARTVFCTTLDTICRQHGVSVVHFLKIDVEGAEKEVLQGFSFDKVRPWVLVIEATLPMSTHDASTEWETLILSKGYEMVYFDGLNRYYIAEEQGSLREYFKTPPNVFDEYITYHHYQALLTLSKLGPILRIFKILNGLKAWIVIVTEPFKKFVGKILRISLKSGRIRKIGGRLLKNHPFLISRLAAFTGEPSIPKSSDTPITFKKLPCHARKVYLDLKVFYDPSFVRNKRIRG